MNNVNQKVNVEEQIKKARDIYNEIFKLESIESKNSIKMGECIKSATSPVFFKYIINVPEENVFDISKTPVIPESVCSIIEGTEYNDTIKKELNQIYGYLLMFVANTDLPIISVNMQKLNKLVFDNGIVLSMGKCQSYLRILQQKRLILMYYKKNALNRTIFLPYVATSSLINKNYHKKDYKFQNNLIINLDTIQKLSQIIIPDAFFLIFYTYLLILWHDEKCKNIHTTVSSLLDISGLKNANDVKKYLSTLENIKILKYYSESEDNIIITFLEEPPFIKEVN